MGELGVSIVLFLKIKALTHCLVHIYLYYILTLCRIIFLCANLPRGLWLGNSFRRLLGRIECCVWEWVSWLLIRKLLGDWECCERILRHELNLTENIPLWYMILEVYIQSDFPLLFVNTQMLAVFFTKIAFLIMEQLGTLACGVRTPRVLIVNSDQLLCNPLNFFALFWIVINSSCFSSTQYCKPVSHK